MVDPLDSSHGGGVANRRTVLVLQGGQTVIGVWRRSRPGPQSDLQNRLRYIEDRAKGIERNADSTKVEKELAYLLSYVAGILDKHLREGEE